MTVPPTLNSKLRVLVAKTYRAEKLYSSIRNQRNEKSANAGALAEMANDVRAREWERSHYQLRIALNEILSLGSNSAVVAEILRLRERFYQSTAENTALLDTGTEALMENVKRHEFAHAFKLSLELVRCKAKAQAGKVIIDELSAVLESSAKSAAAASHQRTPADKPYLPAESSPAESSRVCQPASTVSPAGNSSTEQVRSNVIPLRPRMAAGGHGARR